MEKGAANIQAWFKKILMRFLLLFLIVLFVYSPGKAQFSERGYPEHFVAGALIGGAVTYYTFKKTDDKIKAWILGFSASAMTGLLKEVIDPVLFNSTRNWTDFNYTALGGVAGASIVIPLRSTRKKSRVTFQLHHFPERDTR